MAKNPNVILLEVTQKCNLNCKYCSAYSMRGMEFGQDLTLEEEKLLIDSISSWYKGSRPPLLLLTGGEPLMRDDIYELIEYAGRKGLLTGLATNGTLLTEKAAGRLKEAGIYRVAIDLDGASEEVHNSLRGEFKEAIRGIEHCKAHGLSLQVNSMITNVNKNEMANILQLAETLGVDAWHVFFLVPVKQFNEDYMLSPEEYEKSLRWLASVRDEAKIEVAATCAPQYLRFFGEVTRGKWRVARGCSAGISFVYLSHKGNVYPCDHLPVLAGNIRERDFKDIWDDSEVFQNLRDFSQLKGKCGNCEYKDICGGCRARAYFDYGDYLQEDPACFYQPQSK
jgi:radical SAM protein with 4Fe4S-binding SPASM domain